MMTHVCVNLISPTMIGGQDTQACDDPPTLRVPSIRGMLRFWTRALAGGSPRQAESDIWGSTETGQGVSVLCTGALPSPRRHLVIRVNVDHGAVRPPMVQPGLERVHIRFRLPDPQLLPRLRAVVWTWLHLGSIGRRARRGYGSLQWVPETGDLLSEFIDFKPEKDLASRDTLRTYLAKGLTKTLEIHPPMLVPDRVTGDWFRLQTPDQVFVGRELPDGYDPAGGSTEQTLHGLAEDSRGHAHGELGSSAKPRHASPMMWRVFRLATGKLVPVMTWSPLRTASVPPSGLHDYLTSNLGISRSLAGNPLT